MVRKLERPTGHWRFVLTPTRSASWTEVQHFFALIAGVSVVIAMTFTILGFWPVLPFAGAELALLWYCFYCNARTGLVREVIDIDERTVAVERGLRTKKYRWDFQRAWTRVRLQAAPVRLHPSSLVLGSHGKGVKLGKFLTEEERADVAQDLTRILQRSPAITL